MAERSSRISGRYIIKNDSFLRKQAERGDPRDPFYKAILSATTFEEYYSAAGDLVAHVSTRKNRPNVTADMEVKYMLKSKWIERFDIQIGRSPFQIGMRISVLKRATRNGCLVPAA